MEKTIYIPGDLVMTNKYLDSDTILVIKNALIKCIDNRISLNKKLIDETNYMRINKIRRYGK